MDKGPETGINLFGRENVQVLVINYWGQTKRFDIELIDQEGRLTIHDYPLNFQHYLDELLSTWGTKIYRVAINIDHTIGVTHSYSTVLIFTEFGDQDFGGES